MGEWLTKYSNKKLKCHRLNIQGRLQSSLFSWIFKETVQHRSINKRKCFFVIYLAEENFWFSAEEWVSEPHWQCFVWYLLTLTFLDHELMSVPSHKYSRALDFRGQCVNGEDNFFLIMMKSLFLPSLYISKQSEEFLFFFSLEVLNWSTNKVLRVPFS